jgi:hypothetical protein
MGLIRRSLHIATGGAIAPNSKKQRLIRQHLAELRGKTPEEVRRARGRFEYAHPVGPYKKYSKYASQAAPQAEEPVRQAEDAREAEVERDPRVLKAEEARAAAHHKMVSALGHSSDESLMLLQCADAVALAEAAKDEARVRFGLIDADEEARRATARHDEKVDRHAWEDYRHEDEAALAAARGKFGLPVLQDDDPATAISVSGLLRMGFLTPAALVAGLGPGAIPAGLQVWEEALQVMTSRTAERQPLEGDEIVRRDTRARYLRRTREGIGEIREKCRA